MGNIKRQVESQVEKKRMGNKSIRGKKQAEIFPNFQKYVYRFEKSARSQDRDEESSTEAHYIQSGGRSR